MGCTKRTPQRDSENTYPEKVWPQEGHCGEVHHWQKSFRWQCIQQNEEGGSIQGAHAEGQGREIDGIHTTLVLFRTTHILPKSKYIRKAMVPDSSSNTHVNATNVGCHPLLSTLV